MFGKGDASRIGFGPNYPGRGRRHVLGLPEFSRLTVEDPVEAVRMDAAVDPEIIGPAQLPGLDPSPYDFGPGLGVGRGRGIGRRIGLIAQSPELPVQTQTQVVPVPVPSPAREPVPVLRSPLDIVQAAAAAAGHPNGDSDALMAMATLRFSPKVRAAIAAAVKAGGTGTFELPPNRCTDLSCKGTRLITALLPFPEHISHFLQIEPLPPETVVKMEDIRRGLQDEFKKCAQFMNGSEYTNCQIFRYPDMTLLEVQKLMVLTKCVYNLHAAGAKRDKHEKECFLIMYRRNRCGEWGDL